MEVGHRGLEVVVPQTVFDIGGGSAPGKHIDGTGVAKTVHRVDAFEPLRSEGYGQVFFAKTIDSKAGELLTALINKEALLIEGFWGWAESSDIELKEVGGFRFQLNEAKAVALAEDGQGFLFWVEEVQVQSGNLTCPGAGIKKEMKEGVITEAFFSFKVDGMKDVEDLLWVEESDEGFLGSLLWD